MKPIIAIPAVAALVYRAWSRKSLTPLGIFTAAVTAVAHAVHPWLTPFALLVVFYLGGTKVTKVKHDIKARLTLSATGAEGGEGTRTHIQVLANSLVASVLAVLHARVLSTRPSSSAACFSFGADPPDLLVVGIVANYAAVAADTFSSELGILSKSKPRLITSPTLRVVPPGTNGGVTATGLLAGVLGAWTIALTSSILLPFCSDSSNGGYNLKERAVWAVVMTVCGACGSVLDSVLGGLLQASVVDKRTGKIVEGSGGKKVLVHPSSTKPGSTADASSRADADATGSTHLRTTETVANAIALKGSRLSSTSAGTQSGRRHNDESESRRVESGRDILDNNAVNFLMALTMSVGAMGVAAWTWGVDVSAIQQLLT